MKCLLALSCLLLSFHPGSSLLVLDKNMKKPVQIATGFTTAQFKEDCFPVYEAEMEEIVAATDKVVKLMEKEPTCYRFDTVSTEHTRFIVMQDCDVVHTFSVVMITTIEESHTSFGFTIVKKEDNKRKAQQKLLDFATYLAP